MSLERLKAQARRTVTEILDRALATTKNDWCSIVRKLSLRTCVADLWQIDEPSGMRVTFRHLHANKVEIFPHAFCQLINVEPVFRAVQETRIRGSGCMQASWRHT